MFPLGQAGFREVDFRVQAAQPIQYTIETHGPGGLGDLLFGCGRPQVHQVLAQRSGEDVRLLRHHRNQTCTVRTQKAGRPADRDRAAVRTQHACQQGGQRGLADPAGPDDGEMVSRGEIQRKSLDDRLPSAVCERESAYGQIGRFIRRWRRSRDVTDPVFPLPAGFHQARMVDAQRDQFGQTVRHERRRRRQPCEQVGERPDHFARAEQIVADQVRDEAQRRQGGKGGGDGVHNSESDSLIVVLPQRRPDGPVDPILNPVHGESLRAGRHQVPYRLERAGGFAVRILLRKHGRRLVADFLANDHDLQKRGHDEPGRGQNQQRPRQRRESGRGSDGEEAARAQPQNVRQHVDERRYVLVELRAGTQDPVRMHRISQCVQNRVAGQVHLHPRSEYRRPA